MTCLSWADTTHALAQAHYADLSARPFFHDLVKYMSSSGPVVAMVWQGKDVIKARGARIGPSEQDS